MTNPDASPTVTPSSSDHRVADAPEETTLRASLNGDAAPTVRPVTRADDNADDQPANGDLTPDGAMRPPDWHDENYENAYWLEPDGSAIGYTTIKPATFVTRTR